MYIRKQVDETEEFLSAKEAMGAEKRSPIRELFRQYPKQLVVAALMAVLWTVSVYARVIYAPTYLACPLLSPKCLSRNLECNFSHL